MCHQKNLNNNSLVTITFVFWNLMAMKQSDIPISMLRQYCFCPRVVYYHLVRQITSSEKLWVTQGINEHTRQTMLNNRRNLSRYHIDADNWKITNNIELYSESLSIHGICDCIIETSEEIIVTEFKSTENYICSLGAQIQLCAYGLCCEEKYQIPIHRGFILYGRKGRTYEVLFNEELRAKTTRVINRIKEIMDTETHPDSTAEAKKCCQCEFFNFCADRY